ncbi:MAG: hypothetical protein ACYC6N_15650, partial [Pirellulaceae bacterium]
WGESPYAFAPHLPPPRSTRPRLRAQSVGGIEPQELPNHFNLLERYRARLRVVHTRRMQGLIGQALA